MLNNNIQFQPLVGFEKFYEISPNGDIRSIRFNKIMKTYTNNSGYICIDLKDDDKKHKKLIHRLVAENFIPNPSNHPEVNHIDEDKSNNSTSNLEWCSRSHNKQHSMATGTYNKIYTTRNSLGKKHLPNSASKYHNVGYDSSRKKWTACVMHNKKRLEFKRFDTEIEAALHVNYIIDKYQLLDRPKNII